MPAIITIIVAIWKSPIECFLKKIIHSHLHDSNRNLEEDPLKDDGEDWFQ